MVGDRVLLGRPVPEVGRRLRRRSVFFRKCGSLGFRLAPQSLHCFSGRVRPCEVEWLSRRIQPAAAAEGLPSPRDTCRREVQGSSLFRCLRFPPSQSRCLWKAWARPGTPLSRSSISGCTCRRWVWIRAPASRSAGRRCRTRTSECKRDPGGGAVPGGQSLAAKPSGCQPEAGDWWSPVYGMRARDT